MTRDITARFPAPTACGRLNLRLKECCGATYMMTPCPDPTDTHEIKSMVLEKAMENIRSGTGKW